MNETSRLQFTKDLNICRLLNGMWQVSGAHGRIDPKAAIDTMLAYHDAGYTTWDLADHYGPAEDFIGAFRKRLASERGEAALAEIQAFTKWVPSPGPMKRVVVEEHIDIARRRMHTNTLDLLQFHWWLYEDRSYLEALYHMADFQAAGKIRHLGLTNFDTTHMDHITDTGIRIESNQVQFSVIDRRPEVLMVDYCIAHDMTLFTYGTLCGGLLSEKYLNMPEPGYAAHLNTASLRKYKQMIDIWGSWDLFQQMLVALKHIADKHGVSIANVAVRYVLDKPAVGGVIVGARLGLSDHMADNARVFDFTLDEADNQRIDEISSQSRDLFRLIGDCGDEYRKQ